MDTLVARYSRPAYEQNEPFEDDAQDLMNPNPMANLSVKFAMPPIAQVRVLSCSALSSLCLLLSSAAASIN